MTDEVNHPGHYQAPNGQEVIEIIDGFGLGFNLGNLIKYILRAGKKVKIAQEAGAEWADIQKARAELSDLQKGRWYLDRQIAAVTKRIEFMVGLLGSAGPEASHILINQAQELTCDDQFEIASKIAANIGYVLTPEPAVPEAGTQ